MSLFDQYKEQNGEPTAVAQATSPTKVLKERPDDLEALDEALQEQFPHLELGTEPRDNTILYAETLDPKGNVTVYVQKSGKNYHSVTLTGAMRDLVFDA
jgi:hypothetical protein